MCDAESKRSTVLKQQCVGVWVLRVWLYRIGIGIGVRHKEDAHHIYTNTPSFIAVTRQSA